MIRLEKIKIKRKQTANLFGSKCLICNKKFGKSFHFHHIKYYEDEKKYSDFKKHTSSQMNWMDYQEYILPIIQKRNSLLMKFHKTKSLLASLTT